jgi:hypothetical protein
MENEASGRLVGPPAHEFLLNLVRSPRRRSVLRQHRGGTAEPVVHADLDLADIGFVGQEAVGRKCGVPSKREAVVLSLGRSVLAKVEFGAVAQGSSLERGHGFIVEKRLHGSLRLRTVLALRLPWLVKHYWSYPLLRA